MTTDGFPWSHLTLPYLVERPGIDPAKTAVVFEEQRRTYGELRERMRRAGWGLSSRGIAKGDRVGVLSRNRLEYLEIELAISYIGAVMVPLNYRLAPDEIRQLMHASGSRALFIDAEYMDLVEELRSELPDLELVVDLDGDDDTSLSYEELCAAEPGDMTVDLRMEDPEEIIYTSGTTGDPKGVIWSHGTLLWNSIQQCMDYHVGPEDSNYVLNDLYYVGGRHDFTWPLIHQGGTVHVRRSGGFDATEVMNYLCDHEITKVLLFPVMLYEILRIPELHEYDTTALKTIISGGEPVPVATIERTLVAFPQSAFLQVYGLTEGAATVTFLGEADAERKMGSCGKASMHNDLRITDGEGRELPPEEIGEICVRGPCVTMGYWNNEELTADSIRDGWLYTGDLGRLDNEGFLYVVGRKKDMIISGGMNIYPQEIEDVLHRHPGVASAAVIGVPDERWGENVCAVVQPAGSERPSETELAEWCRERIASYKKPKLVVFVDEMPRTATGKVKKQDLRERYRDGSQTTVVEG